MRACLSSALPGRAHPCFDALCPSPHPGLPHLGGAAAPSLVPSACLGLSSPLPERHGLCLGSLAPSSPPAWACPRLCSHGLSRHWSCRVDAPPRRPQTRPLGAPARHPSFLTWTLQGPSCRSYSVRTLVRLQYSCVLSREDLFPMR